MMQGLVFDAGLKELLNRDVQQTMGDIGEIERLMSKSNILLQGGSQVE